MVTALDVTEREKHEQELIRQANYDQLTGLPNKEMGCNNFQFFTPEMHAQAEARMSIESHLRRALELDEFHLVYQPKIDVRTGRILGAEALLRWENHKLGAVTPDRFIPVAEEAGLIRNRHNRKLAVAILRFFFFSSSVIPGFFYFSCLGA